MHLQGTYVLSIPRARVWSYISDPQKIVQCLPDLQSYEVKDSRTFSVIVKVGISFVKGDFNFTFTLLDHKPPQHSRFEATGKGAGVSIRLAASMDLKELSPNSTELVWKTDAQLGGLLSEISPNLIETSTDKFTKQFFECVRTKLESQAV
jgi:carbon monoxide dehydrogenase subunit G